MDRLINWHKEPLARVTGSRGLDEFKVQAPGVVKQSGGGFRLFYTAVGSEKPFNDCQGYILSAISDNGIDFEPDPGIRVAPDPERRELSLRALAPSITPIAGGWRMYYEGRGPADQPTVIASAVSKDLLHWEIETGVRVGGRVGFGAPRFLQLSYDTGRLYLFRRGMGPSRSNEVISALTTDGLSFEIEPGVRMPSHTGSVDSAGLTAGEVVPPESAADPWTMIYSAWQDVPPGIEAPLHPSQDLEAIHSGRSADFAAASIAVDLCGYRSRILSASSDDGLFFKKGRVVIEGGGHQSEDIDAVHAEDMTIIRLDDGRYRMYYAACNASGHWQIASAISD
jgi:predicted GH43/DUF377 family glycosyl hydrolase